MKTARNISWEIRGRRLVEGTLVDQHVATGFGPDAASAIRWARRHMPVATSSFPDADLRAIPDPLGPDFGAKAPVNLPAVASLLVGIGFLASVCVAGGGQSPSTSPEVFHDQVGLSDGLPRVGSTRGVGNFFDRDTIAALFIFGVAIRLLVWAGSRIDSLDREESARRIQEMEDRL